MYTLHYNGELLYDPRQAGRHVLACTCDMEISTAGELSFTMAPEHPLYDVLRPMSAAHEVTLEDDGEELFRGRITDVGEDIDTLRTVKCSGQLAYLNDSLVRPYGTYADTSESPQWETIAPSERNEYVRWLIDRHNAVSDGTKRFDVVFLELGADKVTRSSTTWPTTAGELMEKVLDPFGLVLSAGWHDGTRTLSFVRTPHRLPQVVEIGSNVLEFDIEDDYASTVSCIVPDAQAVDGGTDAPSIADWPDGPVSDDCFKQGDRVYNMHAMQVQGLIEARRSYQAYSVDDLMAQVVADLQGSHVAVKSLGVKVIDLHNVDGSVPAIRLGDMLRVRSRQHGIDQWMLASSCKLDVCKPANSSWNFGAVKGSLTKSNVVQVQAVEASLTEVVQSTDAISAEAKAAAQDAQAAVDAAASKPRVFTSQPVPPYNIGDIWIVGDGSTLYCVNGEES